MRQKQKGIKSKSINLYVLNSVDLKNRNIISTEFELKVFIIKQFNI